MAKVRLGQRYRDTITGFEGVATSRHEYINGCIQYRLEAETTKDGNERAFAFDEQRLVEAKTEKPVKVTATAGGPHPLPPPRHHPQ